MSEEYYRVSVNSKGQVVIPAALRRKYGLKPKTRLFISDNGERIVLTPARVLIEEMRGSMAGGPSLTKVLLKERAKDLEREEARFRRFFERKRQRRNR